jgi:8-oxo-dGTP pyrophosphatase MutT (NUDIX family)
MTKPPSKSHQSANADHDADAERLADWAFINARSLQDYVKIPDDQISRFQKKMPFGKAKRVGTVVLLTRRKPGGSTSSGNSEGPGSENHQIFFILRQANSGDPWSGQVAFPGGKAEQGETILEAGLREVEEEVGVKLKVTDPSEEGRNIDDANSSAGTGSNATTNTTSNLTPVPCRFLRLVDMIQVYHLKVYCIALEISTDKDIALFDSSVSLQESEVASAGWFTLSHNGTSPTKMRALAIDGKLPLTKISKRPFRAAPVRAVKPPEGSKTIGETEKEKGNKDNVENLQDNDPTASLPHEKLQNSVGSESSSTFADISAYLKQQAVGPLQALGSFLRLNKFVFGGVDLGAGEFFPRNNSSIAGENEGPNGGTNGGGNSDADSGSMSSPAGSSDQPEGSVRGRTRHARTFLTNNSEDKKDKKSGSSPGGRKSIGAFPDERKGSPPRLGKSSGENFVLWGLTLQFVNLYMEKNG